MNSYPCSRCSGTGQIPAHSNVLGGVCFKCGGRGTQSSKPAHASKWTVLARERKTGDEIVVCRISAKTQDSALAKARTQLAMGTGYIVETVRVVPA